MLDRPQNEQTCPERHDHTESHVGQASVVLSAGVAVRRKCSPCGGMRQHWGGLVRESDIRRSVMSIGVPFQPARHGTGVAEWV